MLDTVPGRHAEPAALLGVLWLYPVSSVQVAKPRTVMNILKKAYGDNKAAVNDELVQVVLDPGLQVSALIHPYFLFCLPHPHCSLHVRREAQADT